MWWQQIRPHASRPRSGCSWAGKLLSLQNDLSTSALTLSPFLMPTSSGQNGSLGPTTSMSFSNDSINWVHSVPYTTNGNTEVGTGHGKPGLLGVPGGLLSTQMIVKPLAERVPSDVVGIGMGLLASKDGVRYKLIRKLWPYGGGYTTLAPFEVDEHGAALTYGVIYEAGSSSLNCERCYYLPRINMSTSVLDQRASYSRTFQPLGFDKLVFQNFSFSPADLAGL
eukprot:SAG31_NODE_1059_length_10117_cov_4.434917_7_plen_224_part_00